MVLHYSEAYLWTRKELYLFWGRLPLTSREKPTLKKSLKLSSQEFKNRIALNYRKTKNLKYNKPETILTRTVKTLIGSVVIEIRKKPYYLVYQDSCQKSLL